MRVRRERLTPPWRDGSEREASSLAQFRADLLRRVTPIPLTIAMELKSRGLVGIEPSVMSAQLLSATLSWVARLPELASIIHAIVTDIHLLDAEAGYDVSHSEPRWRTTIFVSIPDRDDEVGALRLAESIVHEAMHLHLTNREQLIQFVARGDGKLRSPWRNEPRPFQGVLHGLYVFSCLSWFFRRLLVEGALCAAGCTHLAKRLEDISDDVHSIDLVALAGGLTKAGIALAEQCMGIAVDRPAGQESLPAGVWMGLTRK